MLLLEATYLTLLIKYLGQQTTKLLIATVTTLFYLVSNIRLNLIPENSSEPQYLAPNQQHSSWPWVSGLPGWIS